MADHTDETSFRSGQGLAGLLVALLLASPMVHRYVPPLTDETAFAVFALALLTVTATAGFMLTELGNLVGDRLVGWLFNQIPKEARTRHKRMIEILAGQRRSMLYLETGTFGQKLRVLALEMQTGAPSRENGEDVLEGLATAKTLALLEWALRGVAIAHVLLLLEWSRLYGASALTYPAWGVGMVLGAGALISAFGLAVLVRRSAATRLGETIAILLIGDHDQLFPLLRESSALPSPSGPLVTASSEPDTGGRKPDVPPKPKDERKAASPPSDAWVFLFDDIVGELSLRKGEEDEPHLGFRLAQLETLVRNGDFQKPGAEADRKRLGVLLEAMAKDPLPYMARQGPDDLRALVSALSVVMTEAPDQPLHDKAEATFRVVLSQIWEREKNKGLWQDIARRLSGCAQQSTAELLAKLMRQELKTSPNDRKVLEGNFLQGIFSTSLGQMHPEFWARLLNELIRDGAGDVASSYVETALHLAGQSPGYAQDRLPRYLRA